MQGDKTVSWWPLHPCGTWVLESRYSVLDYDAQENGCFKLKFFEGNFKEFQCIVAFLFFEVYQNPQKLMTKPRQIVSLSL